MIELYALRHAQSTANEKDRLVWHTDVELTQRGIRQRDKLCEYLISLGLKVDMILSSDLSRAVQTIQPYSDKTGVPIHTDKRLREMFFGQYEDMPFSDINMQPYYNDKYWFTAPGWESYETMRPRVREVLQERILSAQPWTTIVASTHACTLRLIDGILKGTTADEIVELEIANASITHYRISEKEVERIRFSCDAHISAAA